jgi:hydrogenase maturation protease
MKKIAIIGVGNILFKDEGVGIYAAKYIEQNYDFDTDIEIVDGGVLGFQLMTYYSEYDNIIIMDTITMKDEDSGSIYNLPSQELLGLGSYKQNAHEVEIVEMLEICSMLEKMAETTIIGIVPEDIESVDISLTDNLVKNFDIFINEGIKELEKIGIKATKKENQKSLDDVISNYKNPDNRGCDESSTEYRVS